MVLRFKDFFQNLEILFVFIVYWLCEKVGDWRFLFEYCYFLIILGFSLEEERDGELKEISNISYVFIYVIENFFISTQRIF